MRWPLRPACTFREKDNGNRHMGVCTPNLIVKPIELPKWTTLIETIFFLYQLKKIRASNIIHDVLKSLGRPLRGYFLIKCKYDTDM